MMARWTNPLRSWTPLRRHSSDRTGCKKQCGRGGISGHNRRLSRHAIQPTLPERGNWQSTELGGPHLDLTSCSGSWLRRYTKWQAWHFRVGTGRLRTEPVVLPRFFFLKCKSDNSSACAFAAEIHRFLCRYSNTTIAAEGKTVTEKP